MPAKQRSFSTKGTNASVHFQHHPIAARIVQSNTEKHADGRFVPYDDDKARKKRTSMCTTPEGDVFDVTKLNPKEIADNVEMLVPLIRPYGCGPVAPSNDLVLRTYDRILEVRNEMRFTEI